jgi:hypothetical protein
MIRVPRIYQTANENCGSANENRGRIIKPLMKIAVASFVSMSIIFVDVVASFLSLAAF